MKLVNVLATTVLIAIIAGCSGSTNPKLTPKETITKDEVSEKPADFTVFNPRVDIIIVIDNSGSMDSVQQALAANAQRFADEMSKVSILDYHIGVVTTDMYNCMFSGGGNKCGYLVGNPRYVEKTTPDLVRSLSQRMIVGTNGSATEEMFSPVQAALSAQLETGWNAGFYRQDAFLAVIFITDANEQSSLSPDDLIRVLNQKKGDPNKVLAYGVIRKLAEEKTCDGSENLDEKLESFLSKVVNGDIRQSNVLSLCDPNYGSKLATFAKDIVKRSAGVVKLNRRPIETTIRVFYGSQEIPNDAKVGWVYVPSNNTIALSEGIEWDTTQGTGVGLKIDFEAADLSGQ
jgi:hypothetical protein